MYGTEKACNLAKRTPCQNECLDFFIFFIELGTILCWMGLCLNRSNGIGGGPTSLPKVEDIWKMGGCSWPNPHGNRISRGKRSKLHLKLEDDQLYPYIR